MPKAKQSESSRVVEFFERAGWDAASTVFDIVQAKMKARRAQEAPPAEQQHKRGRRTSAAARRNAAQANKADGSGSGSGAAQAVGESTPPVV